MVFGSFIYEVINFMKINIKIHQVILVPNFS